MLKVVLVFKLQIAAGPSPGEFVFKLLWGGPKCRLQGHSWILFLTKFLLANADSLLSLTIGK